MATKISNIKVVKSGIIKNWWKLNSVQSHVSHDDNQGDEDFHTFWYSLCYLLGILNVYRRLFGDVSSNEVMLRRFLQSKDIAFKNGSTYQELLYLYNNWVSVINKRGTKLINEFSGQTEEIGVSLSTLTGIIQTDIDNMSGIGVNNDVINNVGAISSVTDIGNYHLIQFDTILYDADGIPFSVNGKLLVDTLTSSYIELVKLTVPFQVINSYRLTYSADGASANFVFDMGLNELNTIKIIRHDYDIYLFLNDVLINKGEMSDPYPYAFDHLFTAGLPSIANIKVVIKDNEFIDQRTITWKCNEGSGFIINSNDPIYNAVLDVKDTTSWEGVWARNPLFNNIKYVGIDGELKRLIDYQDGECLCELISTSELGFVMDMSSPLSEEASCKNLNKAYEKGEITNLSKLPLMFTEYLKPVLNNGWISYSLESGMPDRMGVNVIFDSLTPWNTLDRVKPIGTMPFIPIPVATEEDDLDGYEISFVINSTDLIDLTFKLQFYDVNLDRVMNASLEYSDDAPYEIFLDLQQFGDAIGRDLWIRGVYMMRKIDGTPNTTNINRGHSLYNSLNSAKFLIPIISFTNSIGVEAVTVKIKDLVVRPLSLNTSKGIISNKNTVVTYLKNESGQSEEFVSNFIEEKLLPYNCNTNVQYL